MRAPGADCRVLPRASSLLCARVCSVLACRGGRGRRARAREAPRAPSSVIPIYNLIHGIYRPIPIEA
eukprot:COSAG02_NODE_1805_length_10872_cov_7.969461_4_plen_67_part_00